MNRLTNPELPQHHTIADVQKRMDELNIEGGFDFQDFTPDELMNHLNEIDQILGRRKEVAAQWKEHEASGQAPPALTEPKKLINISPEFLKRMGELKRGSNPPPTYEFHVF